MPEPNRPPWRVAPDIDNRPVRQLVERRVSVMLDCESCPHVATWTPADISRRFGGHGDKSFNWLGSRLRCSHCGSEWVRISPAQRSSRETM
jgi:hypothetical protein